MDDYLYLAIMGEMYKGENPDSEEDFWVPIKKKLELSGACQHELQWLLEKVASFM